MGVAGSTFFTHVQAIPFPILYLVLFFILLFAIFYYLWSKNSPKILFFIMSCILGMILNNHSLESLHKKEIALRPLLNKVTTITGTIEGEPDMREDKQFLVLQINDIDGSTETTTHIRITTDRYTAFEYGDQLIVRGSLKKPDSFETESGRVFRYDNYLLQKKITHTLFMPEIIEHATGRPSIIRVLLKVKQWFLLRIERTLPHPEAGLLEGLLLGVRAIPDTLYDDFRRTGIVHIVVLSGYNVMLVANFIASLLRKRPRWIQFVGVLLSLLAFMVITGMQTTVIRATIMGGIAATGRIMGAEYSITKSLAFAAAVMVIINPLTLIYDISFQLSFLATIGLVYVGPIISPFFQWVPEVFEMRENMIATFSTSLFVMPLIAYAVGDLSIVSPVTNLIILPFVAPAMALGFIMSITSILGPLSWIAALPTYICLWIIIHTAVFLGSLSWASVVLPIIPGWGLISMYGILFIIIIWHQKRSSAL